MQAAGVNASAAMRTVHAFGLIVVCISHLSSIWVCVCARARMCMCMCMCMLRSSLELLHTSLKDLAKAQTTSLKDTAAADLPVPPAMSKKGSVSTGMSSPLLSHGDHLLIDMEPPGCQASRRGAASLGLDGYRVASTLDVDDYGETSREETDVSTTGPSPVRFVGGHRHTHAFSFSMPGALSPSLHPPVCLCLSVFV